ncbi:MAG: 3-hydroxyacyl-CoA dehydrogenase family protein [Ferruginibacter sp.]
MKIAVFGEDGFYNELIQCNKGIDWIHLKNIQEISKDENINAFFLLDEATDITKIEMTNKPVFINSVTNTLKELSAQKNISRINGWPGFLSKDLWEVSGILHEDAVNVLLECNKKYISVPDEPGFISARILSMIINEAFYTEADKVSDRSAIDIAMKLGTNYPFGPFEWAEKIGIEKIYELLMTLSAQDTRYIPCASMAKQIKK